MCLRYNPAYQSYIELPSFVAMWQLIVTSRFHYIRPPDWCDGCNELAVTSTPFRLHYHALIWNEWHIHSGTNSYCVVEGRYNLSMYVYFIIITLFTIPSLNAADFHHLFDFLLLGIWRCRPVKRWEFLLLHIHVGSFDIAHSFSWIMECA